MMSYSYLHIHIHSTRTSASCPPMASLMPGIPMPNGDVSGMPRRSSCRASAAWGCWFNRGQVAPCSCTRRCSIECLRPRSSRTVRATRSCGSSSSCPGWRLRRLRRLRRQVVRVGRLEAAAWVAVEVGPMAWPTAGPQLAVYSPAAAERASSAPNGASRCGCDENSLHFCQHGAFANK